MKPFNLEQALAGAPVITRDGRKVTELYYLSTATKVFQPVVAVVDGCISTHRVNGNYYGDETLQTNNDLVMASPAGGFWLNVYPYDECGGRYKTREEADKEAGINRVGCVYIEIED